MPILAFQSTANGGADGSYSTFTHTAMAIGAATSQRYVVVGSAARAAASRTITGITIAGTSAAQVVQLDNVGSVAGLFILAVPEGTTADIVVTWSAAVLRNAIVVWTVYGINRTAFGTATSTATTATLDVNTRANGVIFAVGYANSSGSTTAGVTEDIDATTGAAGNRYCGGSTLSVAGGSPVAVSFTWAAATNPASVSASFGPASFGTASKPMRFFTRRF